MKCEDIRRHGIIGNEFRKWPEAVSEAIPSVTLVPSQISDNFIAHIQDPALRERLRKQRSLGGEIGFDEGGKVVHFHISYDLPHWRESVHHEVAHLLWERMDEQDRKRISVILKEVVPAKTTELVFEGYLAESYRRFISQSFEQQRRLQGEVEKAGETIHQSVKRLEKTVDLSVERLEAAMSRVRRARLVHGSLRQIKNASDELAEAQARIGAVTADIRMSRRCIALIAKAQRLLKESLDSAGELLQSEEQQGRAETFKECLDKVVSGFGEIIDVITRVRESMQSLGLRNSSQRLSVAGLESLRSGIKDIYFNEMFARAIELVAANPKNPSLAPLCAALASVEIGGEKVFAGLLGNNGFVPPKKIPPSTCFP